MRKSEEAKALLEKNKIWYRNGREYKIVAFTKQWVIVELDNDKEYSWRIDDDAPTHFLDAFSLPSKKIPEIQSKQDSTLKDKLEGCYNLKTNIAFCYFIDESGEEFVINPDGKKIPYNEEIFGEICNVEKENFSDLQLTELSGINRNLEILAENNQVINTFSREFFTDPKSVDFLWSIAKDTKQKNLLDGSDRYFLGSMARKLKSDQFIHDHEKDRLLVIMLTYQRLINNM